MYSIYKPEIYKIVKPLVNGVDKKLIYKIELQLTKGGSLGKLLKADVGNYQDKHWSLMTSEMGCHGQPTRLFCIDIKTST